MQFKFENLLEVALQWHEKGIGAAVATVIETWGSAPRRVGSQLIVSGDGRMEGSVSGGCVRFRNCRQQRNTRTKKRTT